MSGINFVGKAWWEYSLMDMHAWLFCPLIYSCHDYTCTLSKLIHTCVLQNLNTLCMVNANKFPIKLTLINHQILICSSQTSLWVIWSHVYISVLYSLANSITCVAHDFLEILFLHVSVWQNLQNHTMNAASNEKH